MTVVLKLSSIWFANSLFLGKETRAILALALMLLRSSLWRGDESVVNGNIKALLRRGLGYRDLNYLLLKAQRLPTTKTELVAFQKAA